MPLSAICPADYHHVAVHVACRLWLRRRGLCRDNAAGMMRRGWRRGLLGMAYTYKQSSSGLMAYCENSLHECLSALVQTCFLPVGAAVCLFVVTR